MIQKETVISELRDTDGDEFDYDNGDIVSINAILEGPSSATIGHFVVAKPYRRQGYGGVVFKAMLDVLHSQEVTHIIVEIQEIDNDGSEDPVMQFLRQFGFQYIESFDDHNWGQCVRAVGDPLY